jgi:hypothetical protein
MVFGQSTPFAPNYPTRIVHPERSEGSLCVSFCFQRVTTVKFCNSFLLITIQNARGWVGTPLSAKSAKIRGLHKSRFTLPLYFAPSRLAFFSITYALPNLQPLSMNDVATVGGVGRATGHWPPATVRGAGCFSDFPISIFGFPNGWAFPFPFSLFQLQKRGVVFPIFEFPTSKVGGGFPLFLFHFSIFVVSIPTRPAAGNTACLSRGPAGAAGAAANRRCARRNQSPTC